MGVCRSTPSVISRDGSMLPSSYADVRSPDDVIACGRPHSPTRFTSASSSSTITTITSTLRSRCCRLQRRRFSGSGGTNHRTPSSHSASNRCLRSSRSRRLPHGGKCYCQHLSGEDATRRRSYKIGTAVNKIKFTLWIETGNHLRIWEVCKRRGKDQIYICLPKGRQCAGRQLSNGCHLARS